ncbi:MAG TPA: peptidase S10 [Verrucomicrobiae bacterium]|jgi:carboxypeptidase C (cathepsin A)
MKVLICLLFSALPALAQPPQTEPTATQQPQGRQRLSDTARSQSSTNAPVAATVDETPVVTHHEINIGGKTLKYTATAAQMPILNASGETEAHIFYMAYTLAGAADSPRRPLTFAFNGGPGSASIWVHMGAMGPKRAKLLDNGDMPPPPYSLVDNENTWLDQTDLVFIDPVGTGFSRAKTPELARKFNGVQGDLQSVGEFIRMYLTRYSRWTSPLFIAGESYGTFRAAGLAGTLIDQGIAFNGIALISTVLNFEALRPSLNNGLAYALHLPTYTADAWYHKKLPPDLQKDLRATLKEVEDWAMTGYAPALDKGDQLSPSARKAVIEKLARYTGLEPRYIDRNELRFGVAQFTRELLRDQRLTIGRLDGRLTGPSPLNAGEMSEFDPSSTLIRPPFQATFLNYIRSELGYKSDMIYFVSGGIMPWDWGAQNGYADTSSQLRVALAKNPHLKVLVCAAYYDLATPYLAAQYTFNHMGIHPEMHNNITWQFYEAGHMMYIDRQSHVKLKRDISDFISKAIPQP